MSLSTYTLDHFDRARQECKINRGLQSIGETRFALIYWSLQSVLDGFPAFVKIAGDVNNGVDNEVFIWPQHGIPSCCVLVCRFWNSLWFTGPCCKFALIYCKFAWIRNVQICTCELEPQRRRRKFAGRIGPGANPRNTICATRPVIGWLLRRINYCRDFELGTALWDR